jgi:hypothetical protein
MVLTMASADEPSPDELREIGRRLSALVNVTLTEPVDAEQLRQFVDDPAYPDSVRFALNACADALAEHEAPSEIRELREAADAYARWRSKGAPLRERLLDAIRHAQPLLDKEADQAGGRTRASPHGVDSRAARRGVRVRLWPSPESLHVFTREVSDVLERENYAVPVLLKVVEDLNRLDADHRIITRLGPVKTRIAKILRRGGHEVPAITTIVEPYAKPGIERKRARNTVTKRIESKTEEELFPSVRVDEASPKEAAVKAELEDAAMFVAGVGRNVLVLAPNS